MDLRWYQQEAVDAAWAYWARGKMHPVIELPTGSGKSLVLASLAWKIADGGGRVLVATHRKELIEQDAKAICNLRPDARGQVGIYSAGLDRREVRTITVGGVQSLCRRVGKLGHVDVMVVDEAHLVGMRADSQYGQLIKGLRQENPDLRLLGLTATPYRLGQGFLTEGQGRLFTSVVYRADIKRLIADGFLSRMVSHGTSTEIDVSKARTSAGDWVLADLELAADVDSINEAVAADIAKSKRQHVLVFGVSVAHASRLRNAIQMQGISCQTITGETPAGERAKALEDFKAGRLQCITSCDVLTTGFDSPNVDLVVLCRPTQSCSLYVQMVGRGSRIAEGKADCMVLDYGGNIARHGPLDALKTPKPKTGKKGGGASKICKQCMAEIPSACRICPECDFEMLPPETARKANAAPSKLEIISSKSKPEPMEHKINRVEWVDYTAKKSGKRMLRVDYHGPSSSSDWHPVATDWVCVEHDGYARQKAEEWWRTHFTGAGPCPDSVEAAMQLRDYHRPVEAIWTVPDGKYQKITKYRFGRLREPGEDDDDEAVKEKADEAEEKNSDPYEEWNELNEFEEWNDLPF